VSDPRRHHYLPVFYLKRWVGTDNRLCEFSRPHQTVKPKRKHPSGTAYVTGLYTIPGIKPEGAEIMEKVFMSAVDSTAAEALTSMLSALDMSDVHARHKMAWARFLYSLVMRTPEHLEFARQKLTEMQPEVLEAERKNYPLRRTSEDPETFDEFKEQFLANPDNVSPTRYLHRFVSSGRIVNHLMGMRWSIATFDNFKFELLTSDRPLVMTNGLANPDGHLALPVSPNRIFLACNSIEIERSIKAVPVNELLHVMNSRVVEQARKYVYGVDDSQLRFVKNRFGKQSPSTPLG
jgi:hypothetical protein